MPARIARPWRPSRGICAMLVPGVLGDNHWRQGGALPGRCLSFGLGCGLLQADFEHVAFLVNRFSALIGLGGFKLHGFVADGAGWKFRSDLASNPRDKSGDVWHGGASDANNQMTQEPDPRTGHGGGMCKGTSKSSTGLDSCKS